MAAITSGSDPAGYSTQSDGSMVGAVMGGLANRTEGAVRSQKAAELQKSPGYNNSSGALFAGLNGGLGLPAAIVKAVLQTVVGVPLNIVNQIGAGLGQGLASVISAFTGIPASQISNGATSNLVFNPQFNTDLTGWIPNTPTTSWSQNPIEGVAAPGSAKFVATGVEGTLTSTRMNALAKHKVIVKVSRKITGGSSSGTPVRVLLNCYSDADVLLNTVVVYSGSGSGTTAWQNIVGDEYELPTNCAFVRVVLQVQATMNTGNVFWDDVSLTKSGNINQNFLNLGQLFGNLWTGLTGIFGGGAATMEPNDNDVSGALSGQRDVVAAISAAVAKLEASLVDSDPNTILVEEDFEYTNGDGVDPAKWLTIERGASSAGKSYVDGHQLCWSNGGAQDHGRLYIYKGPNPQATSNNMTVKMVLGDAITEDNCYQSLVARSNAAGTTMVEMRLYRGSFALFAFNNGVATQIGSSKSLPSQPGAGSIITLDAGTFEGPRYFRVTINSTEYTVFDVNTVSQLDPPGVNVLKGRGLGHLAGAIVFFYVTSQNKPGRIAHWASQEVV